jgi:23S rRNA pseudouridine1911/1915/1917 synthase
VSGDSVEVGLEPDGELDGELDVESDVELDLGLDPALAAEFTVDGARDGQRLDVVIADVLSISRSAAASRVSAGGVTVGGRPARRSRTVVEGEVVAVPAAEVAEVGPPPELPPVRYRDEHLLVVAKPPGLVVHPGAGHQSDTLVDALRAAGIPLADGGDPTRPGIVHRLDRDTSGLLVVASTDAALEGLIAMLADRSITRRYVALLAGTPPEPRGVVDAPIGRHPTRRTRFAIVAEGRPARTRYRVLASGEVVSADGHVRPVTSVVCGLESGRTHQIRVHLDAVGAPVAGDPVYGSDRATATGLGLERPALHAAHLGFDHPVTGERIELTEPLPEDLREAWSRAALQAPRGTEEP